MGGRRAWGKARGGSAPIAKKCNVVDRIPLTNLRTVATNRHLSPGDVSMATVSERKTKAASAEPARTAGSKRGMTVPRVFSTEGVRPFGLVEWDYRTAAIKDEKGRVLFEQTE